MAENDSFWVTEIFNGCATTIEATEILLSKQTKFQKIEIYQTKKFGKMMLLDGIIQLTEFDEFAYHEMMANLPLFAHKNPQRILVIGGGDGGVLRELSRHEDIEEIDICEIDIEVIEASKKFFPNIACGYDDKRVKVNIADGSKFIENKSKYYDVIIVDSTDPAGPGEALFNEEFYCNMKRALRPCGVIASQSESPYLLPDVVKNLNKVSKKLFNYVGYAAISVPTYPTGMIGCCVATDGNLPENPMRELPENIAKDLRYYTLKVHKGAFANYAFVERLFQDK